MTNTNKNLTQTRRKILFAYFISDLGILIIFGLVTSEKILLRYQINSEIFFPVILMFLFNIFQAYIFNKIFKKNITSRIYQLADQKIKDDIFRCYIYLPNLHHLLLTISLFILVPLINDEILKLYFGIMFTSGFFVGVFLYFIRLNSAMNWMSFDAIHMENGETYEKSIIN